MCDVIEGGNPAVGLFAPSLIAQARSRGPRRLDIEQKIAASAELDVQDWNLHSPGQTSPTRWRTKCWDGNGFATRKGVIANAGLAVGSKLPAPG
eukprot:3752915-Amphidinium_carterae.1